MSQDSNQTTHRRQGQTTINNTQLGSISALWRFPVKGLKGQEIEAVTLKPSECFPFDRAYAIENGRTAFDPSNPKHLPKVNFLNLMRDERLALLSIDFDEENKTLTILRNDRQVAKGDLSTSIGCNMLEQFFAAFMTDELKGPPRIQSSQGHHFTDMAEQLVHIINLSSLKQIENMLNTPFSAERFRANIHIEGAEPWAERHWINKTLKINNVEIDIISNTSRCAAINVNPETGKRDHSLLGALNQQFGTDNFGVYGVVRKGGEIKKANPVHI